MSKLRIHNFSISLDGYGAGPNQSLDNPLGERGMLLHEWFFAKEGAGLDSVFAARASENIGAWIMGRNMFGPIRGKWPDEAWKGWWGETPPYHTDVFVLTHHPRDPIAMEGGTTFHFVTDGIYAALERAKASAKGKDVGLGGGVATVRQYLDAGLVDEMHIAVSPLLLGAGALLLPGLDLAAAGLKNVTYAGAQRAAHYVLAK